MNSSRITVILLPQIYCKFLCCVNNIFRTVLCCACYIDDGSFEVKTEIKTEADVSDDKPRPYLCTVCDKQFTTKQGLTKHRELHTGVMLSLIHI